MEISYFLAQIFGPLFAIMALGMLFNMKRMTKMMDDFSKSPGLVYVTAFMVMILGLLLVLVHNHWEKDWTVVITILAWITLIKGVALTLFPEGLLKWSKGILKNKSVYPVAGTVWLALGLYLSYMGYMA
ncbi:MAG: hypothetical protein Q8P27_02335 [Candidatus Peregrinibacteria bacterium]|nr:hypothetical protein [Candidatus Peregrinibacteria bacterium]